ncbi:molybdopterin-guanine dinucleotide biosynthesis protein B [Paenibacillus sp. FSL K6-1558]|uniref:molybdopterin-guanine dinucleotide biosynthesis protein B n=1 Tax=Paenibacillus sp. FSL K6-1558 TaxID=2921473 RepID=UPI0012B7B3A9|nr:molybdopterin-guanine dinucleotide biosynthesis protein B [Paenibacillus xylanexedens]
MDKRIASEPKIIQVVGYKNTGKTTMTATLISGLASKGLKVAAFKHDGHDHFEMDQEGTDSYQFGRAGAAAVVVMSQKRTAVIKQHNTRLDDMLSQFSDYDWIVIEGFKDAPYPKLVMVREANDLTLIRKLQQVVGIVFWTPELMREAEAEKLSAQMDKKQDISKGAMAGFLFHEREVIVEALLQLKSLNT